MSFICAKERKTHHNIVISQRPTLETVRERKRERERQTKREREERGGEKVRERKIRREHETELDGVRE